ncbi:hypothetical protein ATK30_4605 [Amycolatopsis echigonensis]|uniref:Uncharacterized protein n=1 Tax=Amycolatopsis echigonensis TaxID=2576905 RepID=A0A2N3WIS4_9PSEU|nr:hypothetical protein ATK30_4605 [Amycolatopsis niigatensis]
MGQLALTPASGRPLTSPDMTKGPTARGLTRWGPSAVLSQQRLRRNLPHEEAGIHLVASFWPTTMKFAFDTYCLFSSCSFW